MVNGKDGGSVSNTCNIYISNGVDSGNGIACISGRVIKSASGGSIVNVVGSVSDCFLVLVLL